MTMQGVYRKWVGTLPPSLEASATVDALRAICELDLSKLDSVEAARGFGRERWQPTAVRGLPNNTAIVESIFRLC